MLKKLWLIALSSLLVLPALSSADSSLYFTWLPNHTYSPNTFTVSTSSNISNLSYNIRNECSEDEDWSCDFTIRLSSDNSKVCSTIVEWGELTEDTCGNLDLYAWDYKVCVWNSCSWYWDAYAFDNVSFTLVPNVDTPVDPEDPVDPENPEDPENPDTDWSISIPSWFTDSINWLVSSFAWSIWNYAPTIIIVWLGVVLLFAFWWYIRHASSELFTLNRKWKKSLSWFQKEDLVNMYTNWKNDRVSKHDVNNIIENDYDYDDVSRRAESYADNELRNTDWFYSMSSEDRMEIWWKYKSDYINKHFKEK